MPCYDDRDAKDREAAEIAAAVRGFLLCRLMGAMNDTTFAEMAMVWFRAHQQVDAAATFAKAHRQPVYWKDLDTTKSYLKRIEREIHERLVKANLLEKI